jgi:CxC2 like cysteine cluster associated with KDZ transposases
VHVGEACACGGSAKRTTHCRDCFCYKISCSNCFINAHRHLPTHWAEVWDFDQGFFIRHDIAMLQEDIASINLGHYGQPCHSAHATLNIFEVIDTNGIHKTKIRFCTCQGSADRTEQLMCAQLFPATMVQLSLFMYFVNSTSITWKGKNQPTTSLAPCIAFLITCFHSMYLYV